MTTNAYPPAEPGLKFYFNRKWRAEECMAASNEFNSPLSAIEYLRDIHGDPIGVKLDPLNDLRDNKRALVFLQTFRNELTWYGLLEAFVQKYEIPECALSLAQAPAYSFRQWKALVRRSDPRLHEVFCGSWVEYDFATLRDPKGSDSFPGFQLICGGNPDWRIDGVLQPKDDGPAYYWRRLP